MKARSVAPVARVLLAVAMLALAAWMWGQLPTKMQSWAPITVVGKVGDRIDGRNLAVTVHEVKVARTIAFSNDGVPVEMSTSGVWLAIGLSYEPLLSAESPTFVLKADGKTFESPLDGFTKNAPPGLVDRSVVSFELPELPSAAELLIYNKTSDQYGNPLPAPLDSQISVSLEVPREAQASVNLNKVADG